MLNVLNVRMKGGAALEAGGAEGLPTTDEWDTGTVVETAQDRMLDVHC
jgi:hypothetical protein